MQVAEEDTVIHTSSINKLTGGQEGKQYISFKKNTKVQQHLKPPLTPLGPDMVKIRV